LVFEEKIENKLKGYDLFLFWLFKNRILLKYFWNHRKHGKNYVIDKSNYKKYMHYFDWKLTGSENLWEEKMYEWINFYKNKYNIS
jgi:hypothetical protein